jgi:hypothetical protein
MTRSNNFPGNYGSFYEFVKKQPVTGRIPPVKPFLTVTQKFFDENMRLPGIMAGLHYYI